ncbi:MAG: PilZ domain-containing protein, partial [bacterium]
MDTGISRKWMDLRDNQRLPIETAVGVAVASGLRRFFVNKPQFRGDMRNASQGGLLLRVDRVVPPGAVLKVWVQVEYKGEWQTLELPGDVIWSRPDNSTGSFLMGVCLRSRPGRSM